MELTKTQLNYILAIKQLMGSEVSQKYICDCLGVKKSTASIALKNLEEIGYILKVEKNGICEYNLTETAWSVIQAIEKEKYEFISLFNGYLGIDYKSCVKEYNRICGYLSEDFTEKLSILRKNKYNTLNINAQQGFIGYEESSYKLPFRVMQIGSDSPSMGDKGFKHPAKLIINRYECAVCLEAKEINYKSKSGQKVKGILDTLYYMDENLKWVLSKSAANSLWKIPMNNIFIQKDKFDEPTLGIIKIKASSTNMKMPQSIAEIIFNFKLMKNESRSPA